MTTDLHRRTWVYKQPPSVYEIGCDLCGGPVEWSEYEHLVWCWRCLKDTEGTGGIFDGPIGINLCKALGISFDRINLETHKLEKTIEGNEGWWK